MVSIKWFIKSSEHLYTIFSENMSFFMTDIKGYSMSRRYNECQLQNCLIRFLYKRN